MMRDPKGKTPEDMFPMLFEDDDEEDLEPQLTPEECAGLQADMDAFNAMNAQLHQGEFLFGKPLRRFCLIGKE